MTQQHLTPFALPDKSFTDAALAVERLIELYTSSTTFLRNAFAEYLNGELPEGQYRAYYPEVRLRTHSYQRADSRLSYGHVDQPGFYSTTITQPQLFAQYFKHQLELLIVNHSEEVVVGYSKVAIPLHFALELGTPVESGAASSIGSGIDEFCLHARRLMRDGNSSYHAFVEPGNVITRSGSAKPSSGNPPANAPQMPAYHLVADKGCGITLINIGVGPSNANAGTRVCARRQSVG